MKSQGTERLQELLRQAFPPVGDRAESSGDLWAAMQRKLRVEAAPGPQKVLVPWFDWALAAGLVASLALFPTWIPVLLYYL
jgi:hypothetical protein